MGKLGEYISIISNEARRLRFLAINARIETLKAESYYLNCDKEIKDCLITEAKLLVLLVERYGENTETLNEILSGCGISDVLITNDSNVVIASIPASLSGKKFDVPNMKSKLAEHDGVVELAEKSFADGTVEKTIMVSRRDSNGIVHIRHKYKKSTGIITVKSFDVVAQELGKIAKALEVITDDVLNCINDGIDSEASLGILVRKMHTMDKDARMSNLVAIRAKIESAQASNENNKMDDTLAYHMTIQVKLLQRLISDDIPDYKYMVELTTYCGIDEIWGTDNKGKVLYTNAEGGTEFTFKNEGQTAQFFPVFGMLHQVVAAPPQKRSWDNKVMKYVGTGNFRNGLIQVGRIANFKGNRAALGFSNVAVSAEKISKYVLDIAGEAKDELELIKQDLSQNIEQNAEQDVSQDVEQNTEQCIAQNVEQNTEQNVEQNTEQNVEQNTESQLQNDQIS